MEVQPAQLQASSLHISVEDAIVAIDASIQQGWEVASTIGMPEVSPGTKRMKYDQWHFSAHRTLTEVTGHAALLNRFRARPSPSPPDGLMSLPTSETKYQSLLYEAIQAGINELESIVGDLRAVAEPPVSRLDEAMALLDILIRRATGGFEYADDRAYRETRTRFMKDPSIAEQMPRFIGTMRTLDQFWDFIKVKFPTYAQRREYLREELHPLLTILEGSADSSPIGDSVTRTLTTYSVETVQAEWKRISSRLQTDPEAALTSSRSLIESVCKHILEESEVDFNESSNVYRLTSQLLELAPDQQYQQVFRQLTGACQTIVGSVEGIRNAYGDAHGKGSRRSRPLQRHAEFAVNVAGSLAVFLIKTFQEQSVVD